MDKKYRWMFDVRRMRKHVQWLQKRKYAKPREDIYDRLTMHFLFRSVNQINEACNKLWATVETYYHVLKCGPVCKDFSKEFLPTSTVPTLHYANMSSLVANLALFGVCLWAERGQRMRYYNLVRTNEGIFMVERKQYLVKLCGTAKNGWHAQVIQTYEILQKKGIMLPKVDIDQCKGLQKERNKFDYDVLSKTTMNGMYGMDTYFKYLPMITQTIDDSIESMKKIVVEIPNKCDIQHSKFFLRGNITANLRKAKFHRAYLDNVVFADCKWPKRIYEEVHMKDERLSYKELETIYRNLKQNMQRHGDYLKAGEFYYREMECRKKDMRKKKLSFDAIKSLGYSLLKYTCGYGEKPERTVVLSIISVFGFALIYGITECLRYTVPNPCLSQQIKDSIYFSFVTFTTLGLGDIRPLNDLGKFLICCEAVIGAFLIALFVVVFARKMMR